MTAFRKARVHKGKLDPTEHEIQAGIIREKNLLVKEIPELEWLHAIPNGAKLPFFYGKDEKRVCIQASYLKAEGLTPGVLDLFGPTPRGGYHGIYLETKDRKGKLSPDQERFISFARAQGYYVVVYRTVKEGMDEIRKYYSWGRAGMTNLELLITMFAIIVFSFFVLSTCHYPEPPEGIRVEVTE